MGHMLIFYPLREAETHGTSLWPITVICSVTPCQHLIPVLKRAAVAMATSISMVTLAFISQQTAEVDEVCAAVSEDDTCDWTLSQGQSWSHYVMSEHCFKKTKKGYFKSTMSSVLHLSFNIHSREVRLHGQNFPTLGFISLLVHKCQF